MRGWAGPGEGFGSAESRHASATSQANWCGWGHAFGGRQRVRSRSTPTPDTVLCAIPAAGERCAIENVDVDIPANYPRPLEQSFRGGKRSVHTCRRAMEQDHPDSRPAVSQIQEDIVVAPGRRIGPKIGDPPIDANGPAIKAIWSSE